MKTYFHADQTNKELKFVGNTALNKQVHSFEKEASQPDNLITDDSEIIQTSNINENEGEASSLGEHDRPFEGIIHSQEEGIHSINIEPSFSKIAQSSNDKDDNVEFSHNYGKDTVNENLVFVSSLEPTIEFMRDCKTTEVDYRENGKEVLLPEMDMDRINVETTNGDQKCFENAETQNTNFYKILNSENAERTSSGIIEEEHTCEISGENTSFALNKGQNHKTFKTVSNGCILRCFACSTASACVHFSKNCQSITLLSINKVVVNHLLLNNLICK